jgi:hypothetical protein
VTQTATVTVRLEGDEHDGAALARAARALAANKPRTDELVFVWLGRRRFVRHGDFVFGWPGHDPDEPVAVAAVAAGAEGARP